MDTLNGSGKLMGNLSNYYAKTGKANPFATTTTNTESGVSQGGGFLKQYQQKNKLSSPFEVAKTKTITPIKISQPKKPVESLQTKITSGVVKTGEQINQNITQHLTSMAKKIGELSVKIVSPQQAKIQAEIKNLPQTPIKITEKQKKLTTGQLQQVSDSSSTMKRQSPQESINRAEEIRRITSDKIRSLEKVFDSQVVKPREVKKGYKEPGIIGGMIEEIKLGTISTLGNIGAGLEMEGRKINERSLDGKDMVTKFLLTNAGRKISAEADNIIASNPEWMSDPKEGWSARKIARLGAGAAPSILINIAATIATLPAGGIGGYATGYLMEGGATYKEAKKMGVDEKKAQFYGTTVGVVNSIFEHMMPGSLSLGKKIPKEVLKESAEQVSKSIAKDALKKLGKFGLSIAKNGTIEGGTEGIQELWSNIIATNYDKNRKPWDNIIESIVGGFIGGGVAGGGTEQAVQQTGLIPDGTYTPEQMIGKIVSGKLSNTKEGNELVKTALQAQEAGQSIEIQNTVNSKPETINQEETKAEKPKVEYTDEAIKKLQDQIDTILNIDPNIKGFKQRQKEWGISFQMTNEASDAGDPQAQADIKKIIELQRQIEDMRDARQFYLKNKKTKKSAKEYVESKVKERSVKFRESQEVKDIKMKEGTDLLIAIEDNIDKISDPNKNKFAIDDRAELSDIANRLANNKETANDKLTAYEILQRNKIDVGQKVTKSTGAKFREDTNQTQTLDELLAIKTPNLEQLKLINKMRAEQMAKSKEKSAENVAEVQMGWKENQKDAFDNAVSRKDTTTVKEMLKDVPEYYKTEFKTQIDEALSLVRQYVVEYDPKSETSRAEAINREFSEAKFRVRDDVKRMTGRTITDAQEQELIDLNKKIFGDENVNITLQIMANSKALGKYEQNMIDILDGQADPKATYLHEAVHKYLDVFSTTDEYTQVLEEGAVKYKTEDFAEVEEEIAEDFIAYAKNKESAPKTITGKIKSFFDSVLERIKTYFGNKSAIDRLYNDIVEGKAVKKATKTAQETTPNTKTDIPTNEIAQTPVGTGEKTKSKAYTRVYERLAEEARQDVSYNKLNLDKDADNALEFITSDPKSALRVSLGLEEAPAGMTETAISIAVADKAYRDGDNSLSSWLESSRSLRQTRRGQEIVSERGRFNEDSPHFFIREVMDRRLKNLGSNLKSALEEMQGKAKSAKESAVEKIDKGVSKLKEKIKADRKKIALAQDIIDSIIC